MSALKTVSAKIIEEARARGLEIAPWFEAQQHRLRVSTGGLRQILKVLPIREGESDHARAASAHSHLRRTLERLRPQEEVAWLDRNRPLLLSIGSVISGEQRMVAAIRWFLCTRLPRTGLIHEYYEPDLPAASRPDAKPRRGRKPNAAQAKKSARTGTASGPMRSAILDEIRSLHTTNGSERTSVRGAVVLSRAEAEELARLFAEASAKDSSP